MTTLAAEFLETDPAVPVSAVHQRKRAARGRGHERPHRERGGQGRRAGAQREARARGHSGDRIRGAGAATAARRPPAVPARRANAALSGQAGPIRAALGGRIAAAGRGLCVPPRGGAPPADGGQSADAHHPGRPARPGTPGPSDGLRDAGGVRRPRTRPTRAMCAGSSTGC